MIRRCGSTAQAQDANEVLQRLLPKTISVLPRARDEASATDPALFGSLQLIH